MSGFQPREEIIYVGKFDKEEIMVIEDDDNNDNAANEQGQTTSPKRKSKSLADKYSIGHMLKIPPFRGSGGDRDSNNLSGSERTSSSRISNTGNDVVDDEYDFLSSSMNSTSDNSSMGIQSNFIRRQILLQQSQGNWNSAIAPRAPVQEGNAATRPSDGNGDGRIDKAGNDEQGSCSISSSSSSSSSEEDLEEDNDSSILDVPIGRSRRSTSSSSLASLLSFRAQHEEKQKKKDAAIPSDTYSKEACEDEKNQVKAGDNGEPASEEIQNRTPLGDSNPKKYRGGVITSVVLDPVNNDNNTMSKMNDVSSDTLQQPEQQQLQQPLANNKSHGMSMRRKVKRSLSTNSLVAMLKIQPISEHNTLQDDITKYNLAETVQIDASKSVGTSDEGLDISDISDKCVGIFIGDDEAFEETREKEEGVLDDTADEDDDNNNSSLNYSKEEDDEHKPASFSFIPFQPMDDTSLTNKNIAKRRNSEDSSDTFYLQSIHSANTMTHASDAPDYDYYSISSSSDVEKESDEKSEADVDKDHHVATIINSQQQHAHPVTKEDENVAKLSQEVSHLLGLPKDNIRKVHRGIMSRSTELQLRQLAAASRERTLQQLEDNKGHRDVSEANNTPKQMEDKVRTEVAHDESSTNDDESDDSSSVDLAFGHSNDGTNPGKGGGRDKWERVQLERRSSRQLMKKRRSGSSSGTTDNNPRGEEDLDYTASQPIRGIVTTNNHQPNNRDTNDDDESVESVLRQQHQPRQHQTEVNYDDDSNSVADFSAASTFTSRIGRMYRRFSRPKAEVYANISQYEHSDNDDSSSSSDDENDEDTPKISQNILSEGEYYLAMSMLVYIYALLRETSLLGHTDISFDEIDVNSFQSDLGGNNNGGSSRGSYSSSKNNNNKFLSKTKSAGFIIRVVMDELEKKGAFSSVEKNEGDMRVLSEFKTWVHDSRCKQLNSATEKTIKELRRKVARRRWKRAIHAVRLMVRLGHSSSNSFALQVANKRHLSVRRNSASSNSLGGLRNSEELVRSLEKPRITRGLNESMMWMHDQRNLIMTSLGISGLSSTDDLVSDQVNDNNLVGETEIKEIINSALEEPRFFLEGSLLSNLIESGIEVVWFGDRHPNDVVYSICANRQQKRVSVVFRGTVNSHNWLMNLKFNQTDHPNPIAEDYLGREDTFGLHTGFSLYMTRQRKDDSLTKLEEIFTNIESIGRELCKDGDYELSITGHSLGGALATILAFYAACSNVFAKVKTIRCFTYAAPRVGCPRFMYAFQHLERIGRLRAARFTITQDIVPLIPFHGLTRPYKHVGMHIRLLGVDWYAQHWLRLALDVSYPKNHGFWSQLWRGLLSSFIRHLNTIQGYKRNHTLSEYQRRIRFALEYRSVLAQTGFFGNHKQRSRLKTLDEYYFIKGASDVTCTGELTRISLEDRAKESVRRKARKSIIIIALVAILEAVALIGVLRNNVVPCENYPVLLYPFTGCRKEDGPAYSPTEVGIELPLVLKQSATSAPAPAKLPPNDQSDAHVSNDSSLVLSVAETMQQNISDAQTDDIREADDAESPKSTSEEYTSSWSSFWNGWLWKTPNSSHKQPPCVWGHCDLLSRPYLPWGTRIQHQPLPASIDSLIVASRDQQQEQDEIWDAKSLALLQNVHFEVSHRLFALSKTVSQSNKDQESGCVGICKKLLVILGIDKSL